MIYLTTDTMDQAVYFDLRKREPRRAAGGVEHRFYGLLGNGVLEVPVTMRSWRDCVEVALDGGELFSYVDECLIRGMLGELAREMGH